MGSMMVRDPKTMGRVAQKRVVRARIYSVLATTLDHDVGANGSEWVNELVDEGIDRELVEDEARRVRRQLRSFV